MCDALHALVAYERIDISASIVTIHSLVTGGILPVTRRLTVTNPSSTANIYIAYADSAPASVNDMDILWPMQSIQFDDFEGNLRKLYIAGDGVQTAGIWQEGH